MTSSECAIPKKKMRKVGDGRWYCKHLGRKARIVNKKCVEHCDKNPCFERHSEVEVGLN